MKAKAEAVVVNSISAMVATPKGNVKVQCYPRDDGSLDVMLTSEGRSAPTVRVYGNAHTGVVEVAAGSVLEP